jgi:hypothetical protein
VEHKLENELSCVSHLSGALVTGYETRILQPIVYRIPGYVSDTDTCWIRIRGVSKKMQINADTFSDTYWATMAH